MKYRLSLLLAFGVVFSPVGSFISPAEMIVLEEETSGDEAPDQIDISIDDEETFDTLIIEETEGLSSDNDIPETAEDSENQFSEIISIDDDIEAVQENVMLLAAAPQDEDPVVDSGTLSEGLTWKITGTGNDLTLIISGNGELRSNPRYHFQDATTLNKIRHLIIEEGVTNIIGDYEESYFGDYSNLTDAQLPESLTIIGGYVFLNCKKLQTVSMPGVNIIDSAAFNGCVSLETVDLPEGLSKIGSGAFEKCELLTNVILPESLSVLEGYAFYNCKCLKELTIPANINKIGASLFENCTNLKKVVMYEGVSEIGECAFKNCSSLRTVYFAGSKKQWNSMNIGTENDGLLSAKIVFQGGENDDELLYANGTCGENAYWKLMIGQNGLDLIISGTGNMKDYEGPYSNLYRAPWLVDVDRITNVIVEDGITYIGEYAFPLLNSINNISLPDSLEVIGRSAFFQCQQLKEIRIPDNVSVITRNAFEGCKYLTKVTFPSGLTSIGHRAFYKCTRLAEADLSDTVLTSIGSEAFENCKNMTKVSLPDTVIEIKESAFNDCLKLTSVNLPDELTELSGAAFKNCEALTTIALPANIKQLNSEVFLGCTGLTSVRIPASLRLVNANAFKDCNALKDVYYTGSKAMWDDLPIEDGNESLLTAKKHYNQFSVPIDVTLSYTKLTYNEKNRTPAVTVRSGNKTLEKGKDYTVSYDNNRLVGTATVTIVGTGKYYGKEKVTFIIRPRETTIRSLAAGSKKFTLKWSKRLKQSDGYHIQYSTNKTFSSGRKNIKIRDKETVSRTVSGLKSGVRYYVRIRCFKEKDGVVYYSKWSDAASVKTK